VLWTELTLSVLSALTAWGKLRVMYYVNNWVYTTNHKRIAVNYFWFVILSGVVGMVLATVMRLEFAYPGVGVFAGDSIQYLSLASAHGVIMVFFMIMPLLFGAFANFLIPTQLGVHDVAFPRLNSAAFWFLPGGLLMLCQLVCVDRRYQRMNCFNIREVQSLLKRRFFADLVNAHDSHTLLDNTAVGLRYKIGATASFNPNFTLFSQFNLRFDPSSRAYLIFNTPARENAQQFPAITPVFARIVFFFNFVAPTYTFNRPFVLFLENLYSPLTSFNALIAINSINFLTALNTYLFISLPALFELKRTDTATGLLRLIALDVLSFLSTLWDALASFFRNSALLAPANMQFLVEQARLFLLSSFDFKINVIFALSPNDFLPAFARFRQSLIPTELNALPSFRLNVVFARSFSIVKELTSALFTAIYLNFLANSPLSTPSRQMGISRSFALNSATYAFANKPQANSLAPYRVYFADLSFPLATRPFSAIQRPATARSGGHDAFFVEIFRENLNFYFFHFNFLTYLLAITLQIAPLLSSFCKALTDFANLAQIIGNFAFLIVADLSLFFQNDLFFQLGYALRNVTATELPSFKNFSRSSFQLETFPTIPQNSNLFFKKIFAIFPVTTATADSGIILVKRIFEILAQLTARVLSFFLLFESVAAAFFGENTNFFFTNGYKIFGDLRAPLFTLKNFTNYFFQSKHFFTLSNTDESLLSSMEFSGNSRFKKNENPVFKYDYKAGDYFPKLNKETYPHLFSTILQLTSGLRMSPWFFSNGFEEVFLRTFDAFTLGKNTVLTSNSAANVRSPFPMLKNPSNKIFATNPFYNFFTTLPAQTLPNPQWASTSGLNQKFYKLFNTSSMQQRVYANWRQLKFSREAWRCKLLSARHQKTLFKRYLNEDGVFWSIERNAKDLIPGWAMITPFSARTRFTAVGKTDIGLMGVLLVLNSSIISGANFLVTYRYLSTLNNRKVRDARAFFTEAVIVASWMMILANPMLAIGIIMLLSDRHWQTSFFDYSGGGDTVLFQHMFWFFGHPEVYVIIIPTFGFTNTMLSFYLRKRVSARASLLYSMYTIAFLGFFVWGHHMYMVGLAHTTRMLFSTLTVMISVPAATKIMHWCVTTVNSSFVLELPLLFTFTFIFFFVSGGISGMCVAHTGMDVLFHDTFYVIGHFHVMLAGGAMFASFGAFYFYFPAIFGVKFSRIYAYLHYTYYLVGQLLTVIPMFWLGYAGMPRRVLDYPSSFGGWHSVISAGHMLNVAGLMAFFIMIFDSLRQTRCATRNTFGVNRYNTRLNFYLYEIAKVNYVDQKSFFLFRGNFPTKTGKRAPLNANFELYETTLLSYVFFKNNENNENNENNGTSAK
jgi:heme/copper-type cytochrome/quinol oxidase subunit 1